jgi:hypothetical protein
MFEVLVRCVALTTLLIVLPLSGCTITQTANPATSISPTVAEICVIENPDVNKEFLPALRDSVTLKGFQVHLLEADSDVSACPLTATYIGKWSWDFVPYMAYGEIVVYQNGARVGDALYKSPTGGWALTTRIYESTDEKVGVMVDQLFPTRP